MALRRTLPRLPKRGSTRADWVSTVSPSAMARPMMPREIEVRMAPRSASEHWWPFQYSGSPPSSSYSSRYPTAAPVTSTISARASVSKGSSSALPPRSSKRR